MSAQQETSRRGNVKDEPTVAPAGWIQAGCDDTDP